MTYGGNWCSEFSLIPVPETPWVPPFVFVPVWSPVEAFSSAQITQVLRVFR